ncbi:hypothetical protein [Absidia glauca]|uniref:Uncharacterized protein n=1 Tax=Absidia glauca TaxID=4829 RepID=A0A168KQC3_ABSGL|nr:hypothetical protein [Absidia glauca]
MSPIPHGLPKPFNFTEEECQTLKIPLLFNTLSADDWTDIDKVVDELWKVSSLRVQNAKIVKGVLVHAINIVVLKRKNWFQLDSYCRQLIGYYKRKNITAAFDVAWILRVQKQRASDQGAINGAKISTLGARKFGEELDNLLDDAGKTDCDPPQPAGARTTVKQDITQQQIHTLEKYAEYMTMTEADGIIFRNSTIGTIIKQKALGIFSNWKNDLPVSDQEQHWMACALSSIWDLTNKDSAMEFLECNKDELEQVSRPLIDKQSRKLYQLPTLVDQTYDIVVSLIEKEHSSKKALSYVQQIKTRCSDSQQLLAALANMIKIIDTNEFLLDPSNTARVTEYDFITQVWVLYYRVCKGIEVKGKVKTKRYDETVGWFY